MFMFILIMLRYVSIYCFKVHTILLKVYIIILFILNAAWMDNAIGGNYIALVGNAILLYCFIALNNKILL